MRRASQPSAIQRLVEQLSRLPGIGKRTAERLAFHLIKQDDQAVSQLAHAIAEVKKHTRQCSTCFNITESDPCPICADPRRDRGVVLVVEQPGDVVSIEQTGLYRGVYHVLMGRLAPLDGIGPGELTIEALLSRIGAGRPSAESSGPNGNGDDAPDDDAATIREVVIGTSPNIEGDGTALHLARELATLSVNVTRLARGLPYGSSMEMLGKAVLADALQGRQPVH